MLNLRYLTFFEAWQTTQPDRGPDRRLSNFMFLESSLDLPKSIFPCEIASKQNFFQNLPISSCFSWSRGRAIWNCSSVSIENILPRGNSGPGVNRLHYNFRSYFTTPIPLALWSIPDDLRFRRNDAKSSTSIFVKKGHFIAGFSSPCLKMQPVTSCSIYWWEWVC